MTEQLSKEKLARLTARVQKDWMDFCADPWWAIRKGYVLTEDEKPPPGVLPVRRFPDEPYLYAITRLWQKNPKGLLCKSRQLMISWVFAWLLVWDAIANRGRHNIIQGKRQDDVAATGTKGILGRSRFIRNHLPPFLRPKVVKESSIFEAYENGSTLEAIPEGKDIIRSKVISNLFMDECAFHETGEENWNAAIPAAQGGGRVWGVTTPNGQEFVYRQHDAARRWDNWRDWPEVIPGLHSYVNERDVCLVALHYTAKEEWRVPDYQQELRKGYTNLRAYMRERELDFTLMEGLGVWANEFDRKFHVIDSYRVDRNLPIYRGWDTGYNGQSVTFSQINHEGQLVLFDQVIYKAVPLPRVIQEVKRRTQGHIDKAVMDIGMDENYRKMTTPLLDYGDPAARQHNARGETDIDLLSKYGIQLVTQTTKGRKADLIEQVRQLLLPRSDGEPALLLARNSDDMDHVVAMFSGGYHYEKPKEGKAEKEMPAKDGFYDHIADSVQYLIDNVKPIRYGAASDEPEWEWWKDKEVGIGNEVQEADPVGWRFG